MITEDDIVEAWEARAVKRAIELLKYNAERGKLESATVLLEALGYDLSNPHLAGEIAKLKPQ